VISITLRQAGKRFGNQWVFRGLNLDIPSASRLSIKGHNGSGKSTLLQVFTGQTSLSEGEIEWKRNNEKPEPVEEWPFHTAIASPALDLPEDHNLDELCSFYFRFKPAVPGLDANRFAALTELENHRHKPIRTFSSGMKQRIKLGLALLCDTPLLLLDEPLSHLDQNGVDWYKQLVVQYINNRTVIVCSNHFPEEYFFCSNHIVL
jgi:ABC-type multidrug transport system ATPase subunit